MPIEIEGLGNTEAIDWTIADDRQHRDCSNYAVTGKLESVHEEWRTLGRMHVTNADDVCTANRRVKNLT
jgi:hypothetical protein